MAIPPIIPLVLCRSHPTFQRWKRSLRSGSREWAEHTAVYLTSPSQLIGRSPGESDILLLEDWRESNLLKTEEGWRVLNDRFPGWDSGYVVWLPWLHTEAEITEREAKEEAKRIAFEEWRSCYRCVYFLPGYDVSACNALRTLPANKSDATDCPDFEAW